MGPIWMMVSHPVGQLARKGDTNWLANKVTAKFGCFWQTWMWRFKRSQPGDVEWCCCWLGIAFKETPPAPSPAIPSPPPCAIIVTPFSRKKIFCNLFFENFVHQSLCNPDNVQWTCVMLVGIHAKTIGRGLWFQMMLLLRPKEHSNLKKERVWRQYNMVYFSIEHWTAWDRKSVV